MALGKYAVDYERRVDYERLRKERLKRAKDQINKAGLGAIVTWDEANIRYMTSYYVTTPLRVLEAQFAFCPRNGEPHLIGGGTPSEVERRMPWMQGRVHPPVGLPKPAAATADHPVLNRVVDQIAKLMAEYSVEKEPLGIDGTTELNTVVWISADTPVFGGEHDLVHDSLFHDDLRYAAGDPETQIDDVAGYV